MSTADRDDLVRQAAAWRPGMPGARPCDHIPGDQPGDRKARIAAAHERARTWQEAPEQPLDLDAIRRVARMWRPYLERDAAARTSRTA